MRSVSLLLILGFGLTGCITEAADGHVDENPASEDDEISQNAEGLLIPSAQTEGVTPSARIESVLQTIESVASYNFTVPAGKTFILKTSGGNDRVAEPATTVYELISNTLGENVGVPTFIHVGASTSSARPVTHRAQAAGQYIARISLIPHKPESFRPMWYRVELDVR